MKDTEEAKGLLEHYQAFAVDGGLTFSKYFRF